MVICDASTFLSNGARLSKNSLKYNKKGHYSFCCTIFSCIDQADEDVASDDEFTFKKIFSLVLFITRIITDKSSKSS